MSPRSDAGWFYKGASCNQVHPARLEEPVEPPHPRPGSLTLSGSVPLLSAALPPDEVER